MSFTPRGPRGPRGPRNRGAAKVYNRHLDCYGERTPLAAAAESGFEDSVALLFLGSCPKVCGAMSYAARYK